jgi:hypothetical protein
MNVRSYRLRQRGQVASEYLIAVSLLALALTVGPDSPIERVFRAAGATYAGFTYALSLP